MIIYKDGIKIYECSDPAEIKALVESIANDLSLNYYIKSEVMNLIASARSVVQVATMPQNPTRSTLYYVGSSSPYEVKLVDSNGTVVDMGSSEVDLSGYLQKSAVVNILDATVTNEQVVGAKATYENTAQSRWALVNLSSCATLIDVIKKIVKLDSGSSLNFRNYSVSAWVTAFPTELKVPNLDDYGTLQFLGCYRNNAGTENVLGELRFRPSSSSIWYRTTPSAVNWKPIQNDAFAPMDTAFVSGGNGSFINPDNAIFNFSTTGTQLRQSGKKDFLVVFSNPIGSADLYAVCTTEIFVNNYSSNGNAIIWQSAKVTSSAYKGAVLKRRGDISGLIDATAITSATISWQTWFPVEYPRVNVSIDSTYYDNAGTVGYAVTGGILILDFDGVSLKSITGSSALNIGTLGATVGGVIKKTGSSSAGYIHGTLSTYENNGSSMHWRVDPDGKIYVYPMGVASVKVSGSMAIPLGY